MVRFVALRVAQARAEMAAAEALLVKGGSRAEAASASSGEGEEEGALDQAGPQARVATAASAASGEAALLWPPEARCGEEGGEAGEAGRAVAAASGSGVSGSEERGAPPLASPREAGALPPRCCGGLAASSPAAA